MTAKERRGGQNRLEGGRRKVIIMGAGGRDFHNFNAFFRDRPYYEVVAFTATQIPYISNRTYPPELAGEGYPEGIPIYPEEDLPHLLSEEDVKTVVFSYSDVSHQELMDKASVVLAAGPHFLLLGPKETMIDSRLPVISVCAVRTGCGKSAITQKVASILKGRGLKISVIRHPMAYCGFDPFIRFATMEEVDKGTCTIEEKEEFEPLVRLGITVYAGVDYEKLLRAAEGESQVLVWDGGNNDFPFIKPDWEIVLLDAMRPGHEMRYYPGEVNLRRADLLIVTKVNEATEDGLREIRANIAIANPNAEVLEAPSVTRLDHPEWVKGRRVLVIEDGPTITHGGMPEGAGAAASRRMARELVDARPYATGSLKEVYGRYPHIGRVLPAMGYSEEQVRDLEETIRRSEAEAVVIATPTDLRRMMKIDQPAVRASYDLDVDLSATLDGVLDRHLPGRAKTP